MATDYLPDDPTEFNDTLRVEQLNEEAWRYKRSHPDTARARALTALELARRIDYVKGVADAYHQLGMLQWRSGDNAGAFDYFLRALDRRREINDSLGLGRSYNNIGNVYFDQAEYDSARVYYASGEQIRRTLKDTSGLVYSLSNLGDVALMGDDAEAAGRYYDAGEALARQKQDVGALAHVLGRLSDLALLSGKKAVARAYREEAVALVETTEDRRSLAAHLQYLVRIMMSERKSSSLPLQESYAHRSLELATQVGAVDLQAEAATLLAQLFARQGDYEQSYHYQERARRLNTLLVEERKNQAITAVRRNYAEERKATERLLAEQTARASLRRQNNQLLFGLLALGLILMGSWAVIAFTAYRRQYRLSEELEAKNEELAARYADLRDFAHAASHDLKEPLRNIGSFANLIERRYAEALDGDGRQFLRYVTKGAADMNNLLDDLLVLASINEIGKAGVETIALEPLLRQAFREQERRLGIPGEIRIASLPTITGNPELIKMLFDRVLHNALKFRGSDLPVVTLDHHLEGKYNVISVRDNGIGIEKAYQRQIFRAFQKLDRQNHVGAGIGLTIAQRIMQEHKGRIWLESEIGSGTTVFVGFPAW